MKNIFTEGGSKKRVRIIHKTTLFFIQPSILYTRDTKVTKKYGCDLLDWGEGSSEKMGSLLQHYKVILSVSQKPATCFKYLILSIKVWHKM